MHGKMAFIQKGYKLLGSCLPNFLNYLEEKKLKWNFSLKKQDATYVHFQGKDYGKPYNAYGT